MKLIVAQRQRIIN